MISYISNGGRLGENISFLYGIFKFCKINDIDFNNIILNLNYKNNPLTIYEKDQYIFKENIEMFSNIKYIFKDLNTDYFKKFILIDLYNQYDIAQLYNFFKYNRMDKNTDILFRNWWSLDKYWINRDSRFDLKLLNHICRPTKLSNRLYRKHRNILKKSVAIHIRRGDFLGILNDKILKKEIVNNKKYYFVNKKIYTIDEINHLITRNLLLQKNVLIFSDDIEWCKNNFNIYKNVYFLHNKKPYEDLILMSLCDEVIANEGSSFSNIAYILSKGFHNYD